jgi:thiol-disulfide isomerase/thioredoxin
VIGPLRRRAAVFGVGAAIAAPAASSRADSGVEKLIWHDPPKPATDEPFQDGAAAAVKLSDFRGKVVVVNLWATWCAPCIREMPTLDAVQAELGASGLKVVAISQDREGATVATPFMKQNKWSNLDLYVEPSTKFARAAQVKGLPTTLIVDKSGNEVARMQGTAEWNSPEMKKIFVDLLAKS